MSAAENTSAADGAKKFLLDPYEDWARGENIPIHLDFGHDLIALETERWDRYDAKGCFAHTHGRGDFMSNYVIEVDPGKKTRPVKHLYEAFFYALEGFGSTTIWLANGSTRTFEWGPKALFAIPLNAKHRHFNSSGRERALLVTTTDLPLVLNVFHNEKFVFDTDFAFMVRAGKSAYYNGEGDMITVRPGNHMWETNFVPDLASIELKTWGDRGAGGTNIMFVLADGTMHAHISEMPVGTYKKGHRHGSGFHVMCVTGTGYSLMWHDIAKDMIRIDWGHGVVFPPADQQFHQHFNTGREPARYLATAVGGLRYPMTVQNRRSLLGLKPDDKGAVSTSIKEGGDQVEYEDQDPRIQEMWLADTKKHGTDQKMDKFFPGKA